MKMIVTNKELHFGPIRGLGEEVCVKKPTTKFRFHDFSH